MSSLGPRLNTQLLGGEGEITRFENTYSFDLNEKVERLIKLNDSSETIDLTDVSNPTVFVFKGSNIFNVTFTMLDANTISFPIQDTFSMVVTPDFVALIDTLEVSAPVSTVDVSVTVKIYSEM